MKVKTKRGLWHASQAEAECHNTELQATTSSVEDFLCTYTRGIQGRKNPTCGWSFKLEPECQLKGLGWITTGFVLMCCGHQIASLLLYCFWLLGGQQVHMDGSKQTCPSRGILRLQYLIGLEEEVLTTNPARATQLRTCNYIIPMHRQALGESFLWHEVKSNGGNALMPRTPLEPGSFSLSQ